MQQRRFAFFTWGTLAYTLVVILWGAYVRATGSGAGCGSHWPLCNGEVIPRATEVETLIEFTHRITSGAAGLLVVAMVVWALRVFPRHHPARLGAWLSLGFMILEGLLGAALVRLELVADNASVARAVAMALHLLNTLLLLAVLTLTGWWASGGGRLQLRGQGSVAWLLYGGLAGVMVLGATGAVTALGDTLFPPESLHAGLTQDLDPTAHFLIRLRVWHPVLAIAVGLYLLVVAQIISRRQPTPAVRMAAALLMLLFCVQVAVGALNVVLLAPVVLQLIHLLLADLVWIALVLLAAGALAQEAPQAQTQPGILVPQMSRR